MFNLLPENLKADLRREYKLRKLIMFFTFIISVQVSFLVFIFPTWLVSVYKERIVVFEVEKMNQQLSDSNINPTKETIDSINKKLSLINSSLVYSPFRPFLDVILSQKSKSIFLDQFSFSSEGKDKSVISVGGVASTRDVLVSYVDNLKKSGIFKEVNLPISNLAKDKDIDFTIELYIGPKT